MSIFQSAGVILTTLRLTGLETAAKMCKMGNLKKILIYKTHKFHQRKTVDALVHENYV